MNGRSLSGNDSGRLLLRMSARANATRALGPGLRFALWVQGCPFTCPGCIAPEFLPAAGGREIEPGQLAGEVLQVPGLYGITLSGGEPFAQAAGLADLLDLVAQRRPDLTVICYSGFTRAQLERQGACNEGVRRLLQRLDVLIDGQYLHELNRYDSRGLRGSANQSVHFLTARIAPDRAALETSRVGSKILRDDGEGTLLEVGVPTLAHWRASLGV